jgi:hypothetical protein
MKYGLLNKIVRQHILEGFRNFGIEKTIEMLKDKEAFPPYVRNVYEYELKQLCKEFHI